MLNVAKLLLEGDVGDATTTVLLYSLQQLGRDSSIDLSALALLSSALPAPDFIKHSASAESVKSARSARADLARLAIGGTGAGRTDDVARAAALMRGVLSEVEQAAPAPLRPWLRKLAENGPQLLLAPLNRTCPPAELQQRIEGVVDLLPDGLLQGSVRPG